MPRFNLTINLNNQDINLEIEYYYNKGCRGHCDRFGAQEEPDEPAEIEIVSTVNVETGEDIYDSLENLEKDNIDSKAWEYHNSL